MAMREVPVAVYPGCAGCGLYRALLPFGGLYSSYGDQKRAGEQCLHLVRKQTLSDKRHLIFSGTGVKQGKVVDSGAGTGAFAAHMQQNGWEVTGLEPDEAARQRAVDLYRVQLLPIENLYSLPADSYDAITLWHVLEHVHDLHAYLQQLAKLIKRGGRIFIAVPNYTSYDATVYQGAWAAYDVPRHLYHFSPASIRNLLEQYGLQLQATQPMWYDSVYISMLSEKYKNGKGHALKAVCTGLVSNFKAFVDKSKCSSLIYVIGK